jgi:hypothetical protein
VGSRPGHTIRLRLLKIAAEVRLSARRIWVRYSKATYFRRCLARPALLNDIVVSTELASSFAVGAIVFQQQGKFVPITQVIAVAETTVGRRLLVEKQPDAPLASF